METFLAFIDDAGQYRQIKNSAFIRRYPYYIKVCFLVPASKWQELSGCRRGLCQKHEVGVLNELKWNHLWKLRKRDVLGENISYQRNEEFLRHMSFNVAQKYAEDFMSSIAEYNATIICTITPNCIFSQAVSELNMEKMHLQDIMQRIEMQMGAGDKLALLFADQPKERNQEGALKTAYHELYQSGDFIEKYSHIMDTMSFVYSHHSCGIQMSDFIAGSINGFLRGYPFGEKMFALKIYSRIRKGRDNLPFGYGIIDVPKRPALRKHLEEKFSIEIVDESVPF